MQQITNHQAADNGSKMIFGDHILCAQFLRDYVPIPLLKNVKPENIEDVTERFLPLFTSQRDADTVKKIKISKETSLYFIALIEHKVKVDYNVIMQLFRYICFIWEDYEKEMAKQGISSSRKDFRYPPVLPIVYYEGTGEWTAVRTLKDRIFMSEVFAQYIPDFTYELISLHNFSNDEIIENQDEISLIMLLNKLQCAEDFKNLPDMKEVWRICRDTPEYLLDIIAKIFTVLLSKMNLPPEDVNEYIGTIKERKMPELFANFKRIDIQAARKEAMTEGRAEGLAEGLAAGWAEGRQTMLTELILPKFRKGLSDTEIADLLDFPVEEIRPIYEAVSSCGPDCTVEEVVAALKS